VISTRGRRGGGEGRERLPREGPLRILRNDANERGRGRGDGGGKRTPPPPPPRRRLNGRLLVPERGIPAAAETLLAENGYRLSPPPRLSKVIMRQFDN